MLKGYKFAYLLLGIGIGIALTSFIYTLNPNYVYEEYSEEELISKARDLGMIFLKDIVNDDQRKDIITEETKDIQFTIEPGDTSEIISIRLEEEGIIKDSEDFRQFIKSKDAEKRLRVGVYLLSADLDYDTILSIIMKLDID